MADLQLEAKVKDLAKSKGISIRQLCKRINVTEAGLNLSLKNHTLKVATLESIANELGEDISYFFNATANESTSALMSLEKHILELNEFLEDLDKILLNNSTYEMLNASYNKRRSEIMEQIKQIEKNMGISNTGEQNIIEDIRFKISTLKLQWSIAYSYHFAEQRSWTKLQSIITNNKITKKM